MAIESKLDKIQADITDIKVTMARNTISLEEHMRRTQMLENRMAPAERQLNMLAGALKLIGLLATLAAIADIVFRK